MLCQGSSPCHQEALGGFSDARLAAENSLCRHLFPKIFCNHLASSLQQELSFQFCCLAGNIKTIHIFRKVTNRKHVTQKVPTSTSYETAKPFLVSQRNTVIIKSSQGTFLFQLCHTVREVRKAKTMCSLKFSGFEYFLLG